jgi:hypothetical protein
VSASQAESAKQTQEVQVTQAKGRLVPVTWAYEPDSGGVLVHGSANPGVRAGVRVAGQGKGAGIRAQVLEEWRRELFLEGHPFG